MRLEPHRWNVWRMETRPGETKPTKVPYQLNGRKAASTRPDEWADFPDAAAYLLRKCDADGLAFRLGGGWAGIDLDECIEDGVIAAAAWTLSFSTYTEISPSGTGVKLFLRQAEMPPGTKTRIENPWPGVGRIEMYSHSRFFTVTGQHLEGTPAEVRE
jgi:primase-polymerase (primpol)-like protein